MHSAAAFVRLLTPFMSAAPVACFDRLRGAVARHLRLWLSAGWRSLAGLAWGATALDTGAGQVVFLIGGPLGGLGVWSRCSDDENGHGDDPPPDDDGGPPEWDWEQFERDLSDYEARRAALRA